ncbi:MAG: hypothetical protein U9R02_13870 [Thermodesulfobacteriota bacterium]|nr:hypothetical protein [Thermodesulfobacteriota bacterium]
MRKQAIVLFWILCFLPVLFASFAGAEDQSPCTVSENYTSADSAGFHFDVYNNFGEYIGYITRLTNPDGMWGVWIDGKGAFNNVFESKDAALAEICEQAME